MNGHDHPEMFAPPDDWPGDDDDGDTRTDLDCPFCRGEVEYDGMTLFCDVCEVVWHNVQEWAADHEDAPIEWNDVFSESR